MMRKLGLVGAVVIAAFAVACGGSDSEPGASNDSTPTNGSVKLGADGMPVGPDGQPLAPKLDGRYEISSTLDLTDTGLLPVVMSDTLKALSNFNEHPTQTILDLADAANVPVVPTVLNAVPGPLRDVVLGYIDDHVFKSLYQNVPVTKTLTAMLDDLASLITQFDIVSTLDLPVPDGVGNAPAKHTISGVAYNWSNARHVINSPELLTTLTAQSVKANAVALEKRSPQLETGRLQLGDHTFSVPIGTFTVYAADQLVKDKFQAANLRDALGKVVDCDTLADDVSTRCAGIGPAKVCVGHKTEITSLCTTGLDLIVSSLESAIKSIDISALHMKDGVAQMWDAPAPGGALDATIDRLDLGFWTADITVGKNTKPMISTFTGTRLPGANAAPAAPPAKSDPTH